MDSTPASLLARAGAGDLIEVRRLLAQRVDPNARDDSGQTALIIAVGEGTEEVVRALLEAGADVNLATPAGTSPLMLAGKLCDPDLVRLLAAHGADIGRFGADAMQHAAVWGHIDTLKTLVEAGVDLTDPDTATVALAEAQHGNHTEAVTYLLSAGAAASLSDLSYSPLSAAVWKGLIDLASIPPLIEAGADPNMAGPVRRNPADVRRRAQPHRGDRHVSRGGRRPDGERRAGAHGDGLGRRTPVGQGRETVVEARVAARLTRPADGDHRAAAGDQA